MPRVMGPTIPRWQLGLELGRLREANTIERTEAAAHLDCSESKVRKIEEGRTSITKAELESLLDLYQLTDQAEREHLMELGRLGRERGYWARYGTIPTSVANLFGMEPAATTMRIFEPAVVHGLLQTKEYARALIESTWLPGMMSVDRMVRMRLERQQLVLGGDPDLWFVFDEAVIRRVIGGPEIMREQLEHLLDLGSRSNISVVIVPFDHGGYHGTRGPISILEFDPDLHSPVEYVETPAGSLYLEKDADLHSANVAFNHMSTAALSRQKSADMIRAAIASL